MTSAARAEGCELEFCELIVRGKTFIPGVRVVTRRRDGEEGSPSPRVIGRTGWRRTPPLEGRVPLLPLRGPGRNPGLTQIDGPSVLAAIPAWWCPRLTRTQRPVPGDGDAQRELASMI